MFQDFTTPTSPDHGGPRLKALRAELIAAGFDCFLVPRADAHMGESVAPCDERLAWLTGFTGSAGMCAALAQIAGVFVDGRYTLQVRDQVDLNSYTPVPVPDVGLADWLCEALPTGGQVAYDPWLHGVDEIEKLTARLAPNGITLVKSGNLVDKIWRDRPAPPKGLAFVQDIALAGESHESKRKRLSAILSDKGLESFALTLPDSIAWLLNIRGADIANTPVPLCFAILHSDARVDLFIDPAKCDAVLLAHLGEAVTVQPESEFANVLAAMSDPAGVDRTSAPVAVSDLLQAPHWMPDPCIMPKACKNAIEIAGTRAAHIRDGAAMVEFLCWLDATAPLGGLSEIDVVTKLETFRRNTNALRDISFDTICGAGPDGAIVHYRVTEDTNRTIALNDILLVDSGGQYVDGTTDITRTMAIGTPPPEAVRTNTLVLKGMIAISRACWPHGISGHDLDAFARMALWQAGLDYKHGTGHGVGAYLSVHEGPQRISRLSDVALETGMILSNEPGFYKEGAFGIRIENLVVVTEPHIPEGGEQPVHSFETLTFVPIDKRLIDRNLLDASEIDWLDSYHHEVHEKLRLLLSDAAKIWLERACAPLMGL